MEDTGARITGSLVAAGAFANVLALTLSVRPGFASVAFTALAAGCISMWLGAVADKGTVEPGTVIALSLTGSALGAALSLVFGPLVFIALSAVVLGLFTQFPLVFSASETVVVWAQSPLLTAQANTGITFLVIAQLAVGASIGVGLAALLALLLRNDPGAAPLIHGPRLLAPIMGGITAAVTIILWFIAIATHDSTDMIRTTLTLVGIVSTVASWVTAQLQVPRRAYAQVGLAVVLMLVGTVFALIPIAASYAFYIIPTLAAAAVVCARVTRLWDEALRETRTEPVVPSTKQKIVTRFVPAAAVALACVLFVSSLMHTTVFYALFGAMLGQALAWALPSGVERHAFTTTVAFVVWASVGVVGVQRTGANSTYAQHGFAVVAMFGYLGWVGGIVVLGKFLHAGLNRFNWRKDQHTISLDDIPDLPSSVAGAAPGDVAGSNHAAPPHTRAPPPAPGGAQGRDTVSPMHTAGGTLGGGGGATANYNPHPSVVNNDMRFKNASTGSMPGIETDI